MRLNNTLPIESAESMWSISHKFSIAGVRLRLALKTMFYLQIGKCIAKLAWAMIIVLFLKNIIAVVSLQIALAFYMSLLVILAILAISYFRSLVTYRHFLFKNKPQAK